MSDAEKQGRLRFDDFQADYIRFKELEQDIKSALYAVHPFPSHEDAAYYVVLFLDTEKGNVEFELLDANMIQLRLIAQVPNDLLLFAATLMDRVTKWSEGKCDYPHSQFGFAIPEESEQVTEELDPDTVAILTKGKQLSEG